MADKKPISKMNKAELSKLAKKEGVEVPEDASKDQLYDAIRASREGAEATTQPPEGEHFTESSTATTAPNKNGKAKTSLTVDSKEPDALPESEVPPTSGAEDVMSSSMFEGEPGSVDPETGKTIPQEQPYTGDKVPPAETVFDGGPQPPQPRGGDEPERPLEQTAAPGFKTEAQAAAAKEVRKPTRAEARQDRLRRQAAEKAERSRRQPGVSVSEPRVVNTQLTITGRNFPPGKPVKVDLSASRTPSGLTTLRADPDGTVQLTIFPAAGEQSVTLEGAEGASASVDFTVADQPR